MKGLSRCGAQGAEPRPGDGIHHLPWSSAVPFLQLQGFAFHQLFRDSSSQLLLLTRHTQGQSKETLCIISSPGWQGREHKPVQAHCSHSALAKSRAIELLCSCCSQHSSSPILLQNPPQHSFRGWLTAPTPLNSELECAWLHTKPLLLPALQGMGTHQTQISLSKLSPSA